MLRAEQLTQLEEVLRAQGAPIIDRLQPGIGETEVGELLDPLDLQLPTEARLWWSWHDGASAKGSSLAADLWLGPRVTFLSLEQAVHRYIEDRRQIAKDTQVDVEDWWRR